MMKILRIISRIIVGLVFVFSGFVKAVDPLGSTYKFTDYFNAFGLEIFVFLALPLAILLSAIELVIGISLLLGYRMKFTSFVLLVFMAFFTLLTLALAIYNPVTDCGCFGDALILTNWQTLLKNIVLMGFTLVIFAGRNTFPVIRGATAEWGILSFFFAMVMGLSVYCYNHLPILDFLPYKIGTNIPAASLIPEGAPADVYETRLFYRNITDGRIQEFTIDNFPQDSAWEFSDSKSVLISRGYEPPIHDFSINAPDGTDITESIKSNKDFVFLLVSYNLAEADKNSLKKANDYFRLSGIFNDVSFYAVTASNGDDVSKTRTDLGLHFDFGSADEIALKTIIRSNPGLLLIKNGTIMGKWHFNDFPGPENFGTEFENLISNFPLAVGVDLRNLKTPPEGARTDKYKTSLVYRNILSDSLSSFTMDNFPQSSDWVFVSSHSEKIESGYESPLDDFTMTTAEGEEISNNIIQQNGDVFLVCTKEPHNLDPDMLERLNKLAVVGASHPEGPVLFFGITGLEREQIYGFTDSFISPISFCSGPLEFVESISGNGVSLIHLKNGIVAGRWENNSIPDPDEFRTLLSESYEPAEFEAAVMPYLLTGNTDLIEKYRIYTLLLGFLFISLFIRVFLEDPFIKGK